MHDYAVNLPEANAWKFIMSKLAKDKAGMNKIFYLFIFNFDLSL